jgi:hypothetical protein
MSPEKFNKLVIVGLDGLDYQKIEKYDCENLVLEDFGKLDLEDLPLTTPVLWASMITGKQPEEHGVNSMLTFRGEKVRKADRILTKILNKFGFAGVHLRKFLWYYIYDSSLIVPDREVLKSDTVFEKIKDAVALDIPGYSEYPYIAGKMNVGPSHRKYPPVSREHVFRDVKAEHFYRKKQFFEHVGEHKMVMQHFHYPDWHQHLFLSEEKDQELYSYMDEFAGEILDAVDEDTLVVFCSDHGVEDGGHRDQAFYSSNADLGDGVKLTNIIDRALQHLDYQKTERTLYDLEV